MVVSLCCWRSAVLGAKRKKKDSLSFFLSAPKTAHHQQRRLSYSYMAGSGFEISQNQASVLVSVLSYHGAATIALRFTNKLSYRTPGLYCKPYCFW